MENKSIEISLSELPEHFETISRLHTDLREQMLRLNRGLFYQANFTGCLILLTWFYTNRTTFGHLFHALVLFCTAFMVGRNYQTNSKIKKTEDALADMVIAAAIAIHTNNLNLNDYTMPSVVRNICSETILRIKTGTIQIKQIPEEGDTDNA